MGSVEVTREDLLAKIGEQAIQIDVLQRLLANANKQLEHMSAAMNEMKEPR